MSVYSRLSIKVVLILCIVLQAVVVIGFAFANGEFWIMAGCRYLTGVFQVFISIFAPIWSDTYAPEDRKARWITMITVATPTGMVTGYLLTAVFLTLGYTWKISFFLQVLGLIPILITIVFTDNRYLRVVKQKKTEGGSDDTEDEKSLQNFTNEQLKTDNDYYKMLLRLEKEQDFHTTKQFTFG